MTKAIRWTRGSRDDHPKGRRSGCRSLANARRRWRWNSRILAKSKLAVKWCTSHACPRCSPRRQVALNLETRAKRIRTSRKLRRVECGRQVRRSRFSPAVSLARLASLFSPCHPTSSRLLSFRPLYLLARRFSSLDRPWPRQVSPSVFSRLAPLASWEPSYAAS